MTAELVTLYQHNLRDPAAVLREIADAVERGDYGNVGAVAVVVLGSQMDVFGFGPDSEAPSIALLLHAGFMRLSRAIEDHGKE